MIRSEDAGGRFDWFGGEVLLCGWVLVGKGWGWGEFYYLGLYVMAWAQDLRGWGRGVRYWLSRIVASLCHIHG